MYGQFNLVAEVQPAAVPTSKLFKWKSSRTGLQVVLIKRKSPSVQAYFAVASEANDNSGCPHTLEHIVFMGSKKFPYKGLLDKIAVQQLSSINAFTAQDQTCYYLTTAGYEGFFNTLPVFLDNILHATVEESACLTEVYHIDGKGEEKGVVFCEMQGHEHTADTVVITEVQNMLYEPNSGYATNTGGRLSALRELDPKTIKQYHRDVYRPDNLSIVVAGDLEPDQLMSVIAEFDSELPETLTRNPRPFVDSAPSNAPSPLKSNAYSTVEFPDSSESSGQILISWLGPHINDIVECTAMEVVKEYLAMRDAGKLERKFVAVDKDAAIASDVYAMFDYYLNIQVNIWLSGVPASLVNSASQKVVNYLETELLSSLDYDFLKQCIDTVYDGFVMRAEDNWETLGSLAITEFLYGDDHSFTTYMASTDEFDVLKGWSKENWVEFIKKYVVQPPRACVFGKPSKTLAAKIDREKKDRRKEIKRTKNLAAEGEKLHKAVEKNEQPIPNELLEQFPTPNYANIRFITSETAATSKLINNLPRKPLNIDAELQKYLSPDINGIALNFEQVKSQFVSISLYITPQSVNPRLYPLIDSVLSRIFAMPMVLDDGTRLSSDDVIRETKQDLLSDFFGVDGQLQEFVTIRIKSRMEKYPQAMEWLTRVLFNVEYDEENAAMALGRHLKGLAEEKRSDMTLLYSSIDENTLTEKSLRRAVDPLISEAEVIAFERDTKQTVKDLELLTSQLFRKENVRGLVVGDLMAISDLVGGSDHLMHPWSNIISRLPGDAEKLSPVPRSSQFLTKDGLEPSRKAIVTLSAATDSTNMSVTTSGPSYYGQEDLLGLAVVNAYLDDLEGPFGAAVRGAGLAYGVYMSTSVQMGSIQCVIYESTDAIGAYKACKKVVEQIAGGEIPITDKIVASAVASVVSQLASMLVDPSTAANEKFLDTVMKGYEPNYVYTVIDTVLKITPADFLRLFRKYILPVFNVDSSMVFVVAPVSEKQMYNESLAELGYSVTTKEVQVDDSSDEEEDSEEDDSEEDESEDDDSEEDDSSDASSDNE